MPIAPIVPASTAGPTPQPAQIAVSNGTTLDLTLFVNGTQVALVLGRSGTTIRPDQLPPLPWSVGARSSSGRLIGSFTAQASDLLPVVGVGSVGWAIPGARVDLSCGVLRMWAGNQPMSGPPPGPGTPGDCEP